MVVICHLAIFSAPSSFAVIGSLLRNLPNANHFKRIFFVEVLSRIIWRGRLDVSTSEITTHYVCRLGVCERLGRALQFRIISIIPLTIRQQQKTVIQYNDKVNHNYVFLWMLESCNEYFTVCSSEVFLSDEANLWIKPSIFGTIHATMMIREKTKRKRRS